MAEFKISTNIERDANTTLDYIVTKNANDVYDRIVYNIGRGQHSFSIIGSYGTGKSTFLWALEKHLNGDVKFSNPVNGEFKGILQFDFVRIIGESDSFRHRFCEVFGFPKLKNSSNKTILNEFNELYIEISKRNHALIILVDEFGKYLEHIAKSNPDEMYFIQELAEFCNDPSKNVTLVTTLHQNFSVYSKGLTKAQRSEWDKIKGRFIDIAFDEPVEQLLFFASKKLKEYSIPSEFKKRYDKAVTTIIESNLLGKAISTNKNQLEELYPLDPLAADILTKSLQRYGQNERSLFTFLESPELNKKIEQDEIFTAADCFDYLTQNLSSEIEDGEKNPFKAQWKAAVVSIEKAEFIFGEEYINASKILKLICLVNIFSNAAGRLDEVVLNTYAKHFLSIENSSIIINKLILNRVIKYSNHRSKYNFIEGTDVDIEQELIDASKFVDSQFELVSRIESYFEFSIIPAKKIQFDLGTPRFFSFRFYSDYPNEFSIPDGEIDGFINLVFSKDKIEEQIRAASEKIPKNQIFILFKEIDPIHDVIYIIDKINYVISKFADDKVAQRILNEEKLYRNNQLKDMVEGALFDSNDKVSWIWNPEIDKQSNILNRNIKSYRDLNRLLSDCAKATYSSTPCYRNEMVNKEYLSTPILTARKALIRQLISHADEVNLGFDNKKFPPEKTIYLSLLKKTGIHNETNGIVSFAKPTDESFNPLWDKSERFLKESSEGKLPISAFIKALKTDEFKLKQGFIDFWIPIFLIIKKEDYSLYYEDGEYIPLMSADIMDLVYKHPSKYFIKALSTGGVASNYLQFYKELVGYNESSIKGLQSSYITIYGNFLRFFRGLEDYSKKTKNIPQTSIGVRNAIANAVDPETALFQEIPQSLGYLSLEPNDLRISNFLNDLQDAIRQIRGAYDLLIESLEAQISEHLHIKFKDFKDFKEQIISRFQKINKNLIINDSLKIFFTRVISPLDIKKAYWESLSDATIGKKLDKISDDEIPVLIDRMKANLDALIDLSELHGINLENGTDIFQVTISNKSGTGTIKKNIITSETNVKKVIQLEHKISKLLVNNPEINKIALLTLLEKVLKNND